MKSYRTMCKKTWAVILAIACHLPATWATNANEIEIIPKPVHVEQTSGNFRLSPKSTIGYDAALQGQAEYLQQVLGQSTGWDLKLKKDARKATILLTLNPEKVDKPEGYRLDVTPKGISLTGRDAGGIFYGIQTLLQLFPPQVYSDKRQHGVEWIVPAVTIFFGRMGRAEELCGTIQYLISDASSFVTGTVAVVDGGFNAFAM